LSKRVEAIAGVSCDIVKEFSIKKEREGARESERERERERENIKREINKFRE
jgi:hypothetical protein